MNELDQFVKHVLKVQHYARYTDDFIILHHDPKYLQTLLASIEVFLWQTLRLRLHPHKVTIRELGQGIDFLGYVIFPHHRLVRTKTRRRIEKRFTKKLFAYERGEIEKENAAQTLRSYLGVLGHASAYKHKQKLKNLFWFSGG